MKLIIRGTLSGILLFAMVHSVFSVAAEERVGTAIRYATINGNVGIRLAPDFSMEPGLVLHNGQEVEVMFRSRKKDTFEGNTDYWYEIKFKHPEGSYSCFWVFGGLLDKKKSYNPPWNLIYGESEQALEPEEFKFIFPRYAYPLRQRLRFYKTEDLVDPKFLFFNESKPGLVKIVGRREKGYPISKSIMGEVFRIEDVKNAGVKTDVVESGYVKAEDVVLFDSSHTSPEGKFKFVDGVLGCWYGYGGCNDLTFKWMVVDGASNYVFLGGEQLPGNQYIYSPGEEYFFSNLNNFLDNVHSAVYNRKGERIASSRQYLLSPVWVGSDTVFLRGGTGDDGIYRISLSSGSIEKIFSLEGEGQQPNVTELYPVWPPVVYNDGDNTITAVFSRPPGGYDYEKSKTFYTEVTVTLDLAGNVVKKESKVIFEF